MKGDFSRITFDSTAGYSDVLFQQGRAISDADLNEQGAITRHRAEKAAQDLIGHCGVSIESDGFAVEPGVTALAVHTLSDTGFLVAGEDGLLLKVDNANITHINVAGPAHHLRGLHCFNASSGIVVGDAGTLLKLSLSGSPVATAIPSGVTENLRAVRMVSATKAFVVGEKATILEITDLGTTPKVKTISVPVGMAATLRGVHFVSDTKGYAVGDGGTLLAIDTNAQSAVSVVTMPTGIKPNLNAVCFRSPTTGLAVGGGGAILSITVSGSTVQLTSIEPGQSNRVDLLAVAYAPDDKAFVVGWQGKVLELDGTTVNPRPVSNFSADLYSVSFATTNNKGFAVGRSSKVIALPGASVMNNGLTLPTTSLVIKSGRVYVDGVSVENTCASTLLNQPNLPVGEQVEANQKYLIYLDVWDRLITHMQDPKLREVALGGSDTTARTQTLAQVKAMAVTEEGAQYCKPEECTEWTEMVALPSSRLRARVRPQAAGTTVCELSATAGYRRLENQLYRVEIHQEESTGAWAFKWSRENGSVVFPVDKNKITIVTTGSTTQATVQLVSHGRDDNLSLKVDDWVELLDDDLLLSGEPGPLLQYVEDGNDRLEIVLEGKVQEEKLANLNGKGGLHIRRWDHKAPKDSNGTVRLEENKWLDLEDGLQVFFEAGKDYRSGDYWQIPARTITGNIEWPKDEHGEPAALPPAGIEHHYCCLAVIDVDNNGSISKTADCRNLFPPVTRLTNLLYVGGDGQEGLAGETLAQKLQVRVMNGGLPVPDAKVRFKGEGDGRESEGTPEGDGVYSCEWTLGDYDPTKPIESVWAELLDLAEDPVDGQKICFTATVTALSLEYVSGDGQEGVPGDTTLKPLIVRVVNAAGRPVDEVTVNFKVLGEGSVSSQSVTTTGGSGLAQTNWTLGAQDHRQQVEAILSVSGVTKKIVFNANLSLASKVQYTPPKDCPDLAGKTNVQDALDALCRRPAGGVACRVTVGKGGEFGTITEALSFFDKNKQIDACLCLLPGEHLLQSLNPKLRGMRLAISGCGVRTRLKTAKDNKNPEWTKRYKLPDSVIFAGFSSIEFSNFDIVAMAPMVFLECGDVVLDRLMVGGVVANEQKFPLVFVASASRVVLRDCHCSGFSSADLDTAVSLEKKELGELFRKIRLSEFMGYGETFWTKLLKLSLDDRTKYSDELQAAIKETKLPQDVQNGFIEVAEAIRQSDEKTGPFRFFGTLIEARALLGLNGEAGVFGISSRVTSLVLANNRFEGMVSLYGIPGTNPLEKMDLAKIHKLLQKSPVVGSIELSGNTFGQLVVGNEVDEWLSGSDRFNVKNTALLRDNVFVRTDNELLAKSCNIQSSSFSFQTKKPYLGMICLALKTAAIANVSLSWNGESGLALFQCWKGTLNPNARTLNELQFDER